jgi:hypothetical protein
MKTRASFTEIIYLQKMIKYIGIIYRNKCLLKRKDLLQSNIKYLQVHNANKLQQKPSIG